MAVRIQGVTKRYRLHSERNDSLRERFVRLRSARYEDFWALNGVNVEIARGETFGVIGHNGSGKSTLLKLVAGIHRPTSGTISVNGRVGALLELGAGFHSDLSGRENVYLNAAIHGLSRKYVQERLADIVEFADVEQFFDAPVKVYSSGMVLRLGFAVAVHLNPDILLVDEAISVGDEEFQRKCMDHIHRLRQAGTTIVIVSHSLGLISELCDTVLWLDHGHQRDVGRADSVVQNYLRDVNEGGSAIVATTTEEENAPEPDPHQPSVGTGEIRITGLEYMGAGGEVTTSLLAGESCSLRIHYDAREPMDEIIFGLSFWTETGTRLAGPNSGFDDGAVPVQPGPGFVDFQIDELLLQPAHYRVSVAIVTRLHVVDAIEAGFELVVHPSRAITEPGLIRMMGGWVHGSGDTRY
ncbi:MAG TPA: ABC transporter ATP-binding protein [Aeromicrobium sp.]|nr:ABC transporter ATP-binding protein [Aeromicrobium sp.]